MKFHVCDGCAAWRVGCGFGSRAWLGTDPCTRARHESMRPVAVTTALGADPCTCSLCKQLGFGVLVHIPLQASSAVPSPRPSALSKTPCGHIRGFKAFFYDAAAAAIGGGRGYVTAACCRRLHPPWTTLAFRCRSLNPTLTPRLAVSLGTPHIHAFAYSPQL
jgi:hypothetical protein